MIFFNVKTIAQVVIYLRQLPRLRTLSLKGNPVANVKDFHGYVAAFLPKVIFANICLWPKVEFESV